MRPWVRRRWPVIRLRKEEGGSPEDGVDLIFHQPYAQSCPSPISPNGKDGGMQQSAETDKRGWCYVVEGSSELAGVPLEVSEWSPEKREGVDDCVIIQLS